MNRKPRQIFFCFISLLFCYPVIITAQTKTIPAPSPAQSPSASPTPALPPATPPDQKAYDEARRIKDPQKKLDALEKIIKDFPDRFAGFQARNDVLDLLIRYFPGQTDKIRAAAERYIAPMQGIVVSSTGSAYVTVAVKLMDAGIMLDWAEELAKKGVTQYEDETAKAIRRQRARYQDALGRIYLKQGKTKLAKKYLRDALTNEPDLATALIALGHIAAQRNDHKAAVEYLASA